MEGNAGKRILIVDDEKAVRDVLYNIFVYWGYQVAVAGSGSEALPLFLRTTFNLVLTDLNMPGIDGWTVAVHVKDKSPDTLVGLMTAQNTEDIVEKLEGSCVDFVLFKPFILEELRILLQYHWTK
jgi:CheY-like chemotaxis protein